MACDELLMGGLAESRSEGQAADAQKADVGRGLESMCNCSELLAVCLTEPIERRAGTTDPLAYESESGERTR
ncbi:hypothetical protein EYF80_060456 [Liparis tanakae]|uniref:Uncharacterized protein n=1 Tax=Liparis tanakae TaxID=230148 RepID=A0A4Z2EKX3_9TELE|nr:hypothetical protein EYF80_060456 [Liparis tanakae]